MAEITVELNDADLRQAAALFAVTRVLNEGVAVACTIRRHASDYGYCATVTVRTERQSKRPDENCVRITEAKEPTDD